MIAPPLSRSGTLEVRSQRVRPSGAVWGSS